MEMSVAYKNQGNALMSEGRIVEAEQLYRKAIELNPGFMAAHYNLGNSLRFQNRHREALAAYQTALKLAPDDYEIYVNIGVTLIDLGRAEEALSAFRSANELMPTAVEPLVNMGIAFDKLGDPDAAIECYRKAIQLNPNLAEAHNNLAGILQKQGDFDAAIEHCRTALLINPNYAEAHNNLGNAFQGQGKLEAAIESFKHALSLNPDSGEAHYNLGNTHKMLRKFSEAEANYSNALKIDPNHTKALTNLGALYMETGQTDKALPCFEQILKLEPGNVMASHLIASIKGDAPEYAPSEYIAELFDGFAKDFDTNLLNHLAYQTPSKLVTLIEAIAQPSEGQWDVLDLGCGTGLSGLAIAPYARQLVGVDLSAEMLAKAEAKELYQRLEKAELLAMMKNEMSSSYDVIVAADVFVYIGRLDEIFAEAKRLLRPGGMLAFSVEAMDAMPNAETAKTGATNYQLSNTGRYAHSSSYLHEITDTSKFKKHKFMLDSLRLEKKVPVQGWYVVLEKVV